MQSSTLEEVAAELDFYCQYCNPGPCKRVCNYCQKGHVPARCTFNCCKACCERKQEEEKATCVANQSHREHIMNRMRRAVEEGNRKRSRDQEDRKDTDPAMFSPPNKKEDRKSHRTKTQPAYLADFDLQREEDEQQMSTEAATTESATKTFIKAADTIETATDTGATEAVKPFLSAATCTGIATDSTRNAAEAEVEAKSTGAGKVVSATKSSHKAADVTETVTETEADRSTAPAKSSVKAGVVAQTATASTNISVNLTEVATAAMGKAQLMPHEHARGTKKLNAKEENSSKSAREESSECKDTKELLKKNAAEIRDLKLEVQELKTRTRKDAESIAGLQKQFDLMAKQVQELMKAKGKRGPNKQETGARKRRRNISKEWRRS